jgi:valyl-tRNA synthetase
MPFITEEIWQAIYDGDPPKKTIALTRFPVPVGFSIDYEGVAGMSRIQEFIVSVRALRKDRGVPEKESAVVMAAWDAGSRIGSTKPEINNVYKENFDIIARLGNVSKIEEKDIQFLERTPELGWSMAGGSFVTMLYKKPIDIPAERERLTKEIAKLEKNLASAESKLASEAFISKAPAHIVEGLKKQESENRQLLEKAKAALVALGC